MSKYNNKKVKLDDHVFDSKAEANYYAGLKIRQATEGISSFELQPRSILQPAFIKSGKRYQAITYWMSTTN
ncbi:hypothetical protein COL05_25450 [Bacillus sp. AFS059628]|uniref:DUF1064 domain-containing protein n=1 Tax=Bacillus sp. AFS059628 TaxID=2033508 RepID=UPI000BF56D12|nr:DUF1064 domain-containing protein [Bacillus sp. AFS059628]PFV73382.1 hypothetical protein COL05_25450 [Bacillus sp. AFS059628]